MLWISDMTWKCDCFCVFTGWVQRSTADSTTCKWARSLLGVKVAVLRSQMHPSGGEIVKWWDSFKVNASQGPVLLQRFGPRFLGLGPSKTPYSAVRCNSGFLTQSLKTPDFLRLCPCRRYAMRWDHKYIISMSAWIWSALRIEMVQWFRLRVVKESLQQNRSKPGSQVVALFCVGEMRQPCRVELLRATVYWSVVETLCWLWCTWHSRTEIE